MSKDREASDKIKDVTTAADRWDSTKDQVDEWAEDAKKDDK